MGQQLQTVSTARFSVLLDQGANLRQVEFGEAVVALPGPCTTFELDGEECRVAPETGPELTFRLSAGDRSGTLHVTDGGEVRLHFAPDLGCEVKRVGVSLFLPIETVFHLAEHRNVGRRLDQTMPHGESFVCALNYNLLLADLGGLWLRLRTDQRRLHQARAEIARHQDAFSLRFDWTADTDCQIGAFSSMDEAIADFQAWIESRFGVRKLADPARRLPDWIDNVKLVLTVDMMRSNWEISHDYRDCQRLARDLSEIGCPQDTLFYIPGWQGAYDSSHPAYWPHLELGGEAAFRDMVDAIHDCGYRVMIHTTGWGIDPYHPDIDHLQTLSLRNADGLYEGWMIGPQERWRRSLKYHTGKVSLSGEYRARSFTVETPAIPDRCEAMLTIGGLRGPGGRVRLTVGRRSVATPVGWFADHDEFDFPFPLLLQAGPNLIRVSYEGDDPLPSWDEAWYRIWHTFFPGSPYESWTWPILMADMSNPEYQELFAASVARVVEEFGIDAVHVDATFFIWPVNPSYPSGRPLIEKLQATLPGVPVCSEAALAFDAMGFWVFAQGAAQSLIRPGHGHFQKAPTEQGSLTMRDGLSDLFAWLNQPSPVCDFVAQYHKTYPHLCAANGFVPLGKVCNIFPKRRVPRTSEEQWQVLRDAQRLRYIPGLRLNYRDYGLDPETRAAVEEIASW